MAVLVKPLIELGQRRELSARLRHSVEPHVRTRDDDDSRRAPGARAPCGVRDGLNSARGDVDAPQLPDTDGTRFDKGNVAAVGRPEQLSGLADYRHLAGNAVVEVPHPQLA